MAEECVFVTVLMGVKVLVPSFDYDISVATTFESLLREVLSEAGVEVESLDDRNITVVITTEAKSGQSGRMIRKLGATVMSRLAGGRFITYHLAGAPQLLLHHEAYGPVGHPRQPNRCPMMDHKFRPFLVPTGAGARQRG
jgi:hypothetical protein